VNKCEGLDPAVAAAEYKIVTANEKGTYFAIGTDLAKFVAGDAAYGPKLLIHAVKSGKRVARAVHRHLTGIEPSPHPDRLPVIIAVAMTFPRPPEWSLRTAQRYDLASNSPGNRPG